MKTTILYFLPLLLLVGCGNPSGDEFPESNSIKNIKYSNIVLDTLFLQDTTSSFFGWTTIWKDKIYYNDDYFRKVYEFDTSGHLNNVLLGRGNSVKEYNGDGISGAFIFPDGKRFFMGGFIDCSIYDSTFHKLRTFQIKNFLNKYWDDKKEIRENPRFYSLEYEKLNIRYWNNYIFMNVFCGREDANFNSILDPKEYYKNAKTLLKIDMTSGEVVDLIGKYPPSYIDNSDKRSSLEDISYDIDSKGNFYVTYAADSLIYVYDPSFKPLFVFGNQGVNMDVDYFDNYYIEQNQKGYPPQFTKGRYTCLEYFEENKTLFRSYLKGSHSKGVEGLQVYENGVLVADIDVPNAIKETGTFFYIIGYIAPYYYSHVYGDAENKTLKLIRFKLE